jgi:uncharacterized protein YecE (DUF72 family)
MGLRVLRAADKAANLAGTGAWRIGMSGRIRVGVGGWTYEPWRGTFYPADLTQKRELEYAAGRLTSIEINGTFYGAQKPESFAKWREETPADFVFAVKAPRYATHRRALSSAAAVVERFLSGGVLELQEKLGPINWQLLPATRFDAADFEGFLKLLPRSSGGRALRHGVEARHASFRVPEFVEMMRHYGVASIIAGDSEYPQIADLTAPFVYARIMGTKPGEPLGYAASTLDQWARHARCWAAGGAPEELETASPVSKSKRSERVGRDVFLYVINGHKVANPAAATALIERLASS